MLAVLMLLLFVREPKVLQAEDSRDEERALGALQQVRTIPPNARPSLLYLMLAIFLWFVGYNAIETFFTSYGVTVLGIAENQAALLTSISFVTFILFAVPSGYLAARIGRRRTITIGLVVFAGVLLIGYLLPGLTIIAAALALGGIAWSLVNINSLPMVVDISPTNTNIGTFTGLYYLASQTAAIAGPTLNGALIERTGNYGLTLLVPVFMFGLAALAMQGVTRGEARTEAA